MSPISSPWRSAAPIGAWVGASVRRPPRHRARRVAASCGGAEWVTGLSYVTELAAKGGAPSHPWPV